MKHIKLLPNLTLRVNFAISLKIFFVILTGERKGRYTLVALPRNVTPYRDSVDATCDHVTCQKLVTR